jgi:hypothetical protein
MIDQDDVAETRAAYVAVAVDYANLVGRDS